MTETNPIRVLIADDHAMVRSGLKNFIYGYPWLELVGEARDGLEAVEFCAKQEIDVVLMDIVMPMMDGTEATRRIKAQNEQVKIIILTSFHEQDQVEEALQAGATSYLLKNVAAGELAAAIKSAYVGQSTLAPEATEALIQATLNKPALGDDLTPREREVLALLVRGYSNQEISEQLSISVATVKYHLTNLYSKLGAKNRVEAVTLALEHSLIEN